VRFTFDLTTVAVAGALALRLATLSALLPFLNARGVPLLWRLALAIVLALALTPAVSAALPAGALALGWAGIVGEALRSLLVGALLALVLSIPFEVVKFAGQLIDVQIGFAIVNTIDPQSGIQISVLSNFYYLIAAMLFFALDGHHAFLTALVSSCTLVPLYAPVDATAGAWLLIREFGAFFRMGLQVGAPCILVLLLVSAALGVVVKTLPQVNILVVGFPIKIAVGLAVLGLSLTYFRQVFGLLLNGMEGQLGRLLGALQ
jgi:flagellar biosynthetic protein FliR